MTTESLPLYYEGQNLSDMEAALRADYLTTSGWLDSATQKLAVRGGEPLPWFTYSAIAFLDRQIGRDQSVFEYGGGHSTLFWSSRTKHVRAVDHDPSFSAFIAPRLPPNARFVLAEENASIPEALQGWAAQRPILKDPERTVQTFRSGQLNETFVSYALRLLEQPQGKFHVAIIDGMARILSTWAAIKYFNNKGFIVFDNSDREFYKPAYDLLADAGYRRLDFWGMGPVNPYEWCTSVFYQPSHFLGPRWFQAEEAKPVSASHKGGLGILVIGYNRPYHLQSVLESLRQQQRLNDVHVWIDGTQGRDEYQDANTKTVEIANRFAAREIRVHRSHLGIEKLMLDALEAMSDLYDRILVLEDDCFPLEGSVDAFETELASIADNPEIYSVYGTHFRMEPKESRDFPRFQGWGWAAHTYQIKVLLPRLKELFLLGEQAYLARVSSMLTPKIRMKLDVTPGRDVLNVLAAFFSWDSATALLTAATGMRHRRTPQPAVVNTGIIPGVGHFTGDNPVFRAPPFNMITVEEAWRHFDQTTIACDYGSESYGLEGLDQRIKEAVPIEPGFFIEIGAFDGKTQSNSLILEKAGWRGLLVEANPGSFARCVRARPRAVTEHAACVSAPHSGAHTLLTDVGLMSLTAESAMSEAEKADWLSRGEHFAGRRAQVLEVPVTTLSALLDKHSVEKVDLLLLDVEGAEVDVLGGLDFSRHVPTYIVAEDAYTEDTALYLQTRGYRRVKMLSERRYTRDCLYTRHLAGGRGTAR